MGTGSDGIVLLEYFLRVNKSLKRSRLVRWDHDTFANYVQTLTKKEQTRNLNADTCATKLFKQLEYTQ